MTKLEQRSLGIVPLTKETIQSFYDGTRSGTVLECLMAACESHERMRMELEGMDVMMKEDAAKHEALQTECDDLGGQISALQEDKAAILATARELATKHMRGNVCTYCGSVYNAAGAMSHNAGCAVKRLDALERGEPGR